MFILTPYSISPPLLFHTTVSCFASSLFDAVRKYIILGCRIGVEAIFLILFFASIPNYFPIGLDKASSESYLD